MRMTLTTCGAVALRKESVDRNTTSKQLVHETTAVALRKESVDRNKMSKIAGMYEVVALRKESVDRNRAI